MRTVGYTAPSYTFPIHFPNESRFGFTLFSKSSPIGNPIYVACNDDDVLVLKPLLARPRLNPTIILQDDLEKTCMDAR